MIKRPLSGGKHYSLSIEAPITKVINIILAAQENQPSYIVQALDKVVEILRMSGNADFFSPEMDTVKYKDSDPGLDLLGALLAVCRFLFEFFLPFIHGVIFCKI